MLDIYSKLRQNPPNFRGCHSLQETTAYGKKPCSRHSCLAALTTGQSSGARDRVGTVATVRSRSASTDQHLQKRGYEGSGLTVTSERIKLDYTIKNLLLPAFQCNCDKIYIFIPERTGTEETVKAKELQNIINSAICNY